MSVVGALSHLVRAWRSLHWQEALAVFITALLFGLIDLTGLIELKLPESPWRTVVLHLAMPLSGGTALLLCWLPAARSDALHPRRRWRLFGAILLGSALTIALSQGLMQSLQWPSICDLYAASQGQPPCGDYRWTDLLGDTLWVFMPSLMLAGMFEAWQQRSRHERAAHALLLEHSQLKRQVLAARLAALQAQVEPEHLFAALIAIEQAYAQQQPDAGARLDALIAELRQATLDLRQQQREAQA